MCRKKRAFSRLDEARQAVEQLHKEHLYVPKLYAYARPLGDHFHLTKHPRPLDPEYRDRVNIEL